MIAAGHRAPERIVVVGGGVIGASAAARLAQRGVEVVLLTAEPIGTTPVSRASFAWVNSHAKAPEPYRRLNEDARRVHAEQSVAHGSPWFVRTGAEIDGVEYADDGYVDTRVFLAAQLDDLRRAGGTVHDGTPVDSLSHARGLVGHADTVLVAAGAGTAALVAPAVTDVGRLATSAGDDGFLARIDVGAVPITRIRSVGGLQVRPDGEGRLAAQSLTIEAALRREGKTASVETVWPALREEIARAFGLRLPVDAPLRVDHAVRPHAADGLPVIGRVADDVYVALSHSGVTLAPLLGDLIARDLCGDADPRLAPFRP